MSNPSTFRLATAINKTAKAILSPSSHVVDVACEFNVDLSDVRFYGVWFDFSGDMVRVGVTHQPTNKVNSWSYRNSEPLLTEDELAARIDGAIGGLFAAVEDTLNHKEPIAN